MSFDPGYGVEPFQSLCGEVPGASVYPTAGYRTEWGPIFHRGRLDGTARLLVIGQDPAAHEAVTRRILCGEAGHRVQGFLSRLGFTRSYVMINAYAYSVYGKTPPPPTPALLEDRYRWIDGILAGSPVEAVLTFGVPARNVWTGYVAKRLPVSLPAHAAAIHPTAPIPETELLANWNLALATVHAAVTHPDRRRTLRGYGTVLRASDRQSIPVDDLPAGLPAWMGSADEFAVRGTPTDAASTASRLTITVPSDSRPSR